MLADQGSHGDTPGSDRTTQNTPQPNSGITAPSISLPKVGETIRRMGEKSTAKPVTATNSTLRSRIFMVFDTADFVAFLFDHKRYL